METNGNKPNCEYFDSFASNKTSTGFGENNGAVGYLSPAIVCDNYDCVNCGPKFNSAELNSEIALCKTKGFIENGIPVDVKGKKLFIKKKLDETLDEDGLIDEDLTRGKTLVKVKPHDPETDEPYGAK